MEFDNLFEQQSISRSRKPNNNANSYYAENENSRRYQERRKGGSHYATYLFNRIWNNKKIRLLVIILTIILLSLIVAVIIALFPLIEKAFNYITQNGVNGIIESVSGLIEKIMTGKGN
jgi:type IV secretory pathway component VirB8